MKTYQNAKKLSSDVPLTLLAALEKDSIEEDIPATTPGLAGT